MNVSRSMMCSRTFKRPTMRSLNLIISLDLLKKNANVKSRLRRKCTADDLSIEERVIKMHYTLNHSKIKNGLLITSIK